MGNPLMKAVSKATGVDLDGIDLEALTELTTIMPAMSKDIGELRDMMHDLLLIERARAAADGITVIGLRTQR